MKKPDTITSPPGGYRYTQPESGAPFHYFTWAEIVQNVGAHRRAMGYDLADSWVARLMDDLCNQNAWMGCVDDNVPATYDTPLAIAGRALWLELHSFTEQYPESPTEDDISKARYWMSAWRERIPRFGGCTCREDWARLEANYPPVYTSRAAFVTWSKISHDAVNRRIGKPLFNPELFNAAVAAGLNVFP